MGSWTNASPATATTAGLLRPEEFARHVALRRWPCSPALDPWIENFWGLRWQLPPDRVFRSSVLPHPACNLTLERGIERPDAAGGAVVTGVVTRRFDTEVRGSGWVLGAKFRPGGLRPLTGVRADALRDRTVAAAEVLPDGLLRELAALGPAGDDDAQVEVLDDALATLVGEPDPDHLLVLDVVAKMLGDRALQRVDQVEEACGVGRRRLQRLFAEHVGVGPKWVLARYRMHDVVTALDEGHPGSLAELAAAHGWFDQAHFTRDFTDLVGESPGSYRDRATGGGPALSGR